MPHADTAVIRAAKAAGLYCVPGVVTPTEAFAALAAGADALKLFPAEQLGPAALKAWRAVLPAQVPVLPVGGITPDTMAAWIAAGHSVSASARRSTHPASPPMNWSPRSPICAGLGHRITLVPGKPCMKITKLTTFMVPPRWLFLKSRPMKASWAGASRWWRAARHRRGRGRRAGRLSDRQRPAPIEDHWTVLYRGGFYRGGALHYERARRHRSGAVGHQGQGAGRAGASHCSAARCRERIRVYSWIGGDRPADTAGRRRMPSRAASPP